MLLPLGRQTRQHAVIVITFLSIILCHRKQRKHYSSFLFRDEALLLLPKEQVDFVVPILSWICLGIVTVFYRERRMT